MSATDPILERVPLVCTFDEVCALLKMSRSSAKRQRRLGIFPVPELQPGLDERHPRFSGEDVLAAIRQRSAIAHGAKRWKRVG